MSKIVCCKSISVMSHKYKSLALYLEVYFKSTWVIYTYTISFIGYISWDMQLFILYLASVDIEALLA